MCDDKYFDKLATLIRLSLTARMETQAKVAKLCNLDRNFFNAFLRRRVNLLHSDIEKVVAYLGLDLSKFEDRLDGEAIRFNASDTTNKEH